MSFAFFQFILAIVVHLPIDPPAISDVTPEELIQSAREHVNNLDSISYRANITNTVSPELQRKYGWPTATTVQIVEYKYDHGRYRADIEYTDMSRGTQERRTVLYDGKRYQMYYPRPRYLATSARPIGKGDAYGVNPIVAPSYSTVRRSWMPLCPRCIF